MQNLDRVKCFKYNIVSRALTATFAKALSTQWYPSGNKRKM